MWTLNRVLFALALIGVSQAYGDGLSGGIGQNIGGGFDFDGGLSKSGGFKPTVSSCTGVIDLSTGCIRPGIGP